MKQKKQLLGDVNKNYNEAQLREIIHKLQIRDASLRLDLAKLKEQNTEITTKYHKALKQIGEMEKIQKRDSMYIMKIDSFLMEAKKRFDENKKQQTDHYVDALLEMTRQRDDYLKKNIQLEIQINTLNEQIEKLQLQNTQIIPSASQQQFSTPLTTQEEVAIIPNICHRKKSSIYSMNTQDSVQDEKEDQLMSFLQQLDEQQAHQLYSIFSNAEYESSKSSSQNNQMIRKLLSDSQEHSLNEQPSAFSFSQKFESRDLHYS